MTIFLSNCFTMKHWSHQVYDSMSFLLETSHSDYHLSSRLIIYFAVRARNDKRIFTRMYVINDNSTRSKHRVRNERKSWAFQSFLQPAINRVSWTLLKQTLRGNPCCVKSHSQRNPPASRQRRPAVARASGEEPLQWRRNSQPRILRSHLARVNVNDAACIAPCISAVRIAAKRFECNLWHARSARNKKWGA